MAAGRPQQAENSVELGLQGEVRARLREMSVADRVAALQNQSRGGNFRVFESIENDPLPAPGFMGGPDESAKVLGNARQQYVQQKFPDTWKDAEDTTHNAEIATLMLGVAGSSCLPQNEIQAGLS